MKSGGFFTCFVFSFLLVPIAGFVCPPLKGETWKQSCPAGGGDVRKIVVDPSDADIIYLNLRRNGLYKSIDKG